MVLTTVLSMLRYVGEIEDRDFVDRLHSYITTNFLIGLSVLVSFKQFGGRPIECLTPDIFSGSWEQYAENFCWAQDTYFVPPDKVVDGMPERERAERRISYYQWVPFLLLIEAGCFRLPSIWWKYMSGHSDPNNIKPKIRRANIRSLTVHLQGALRFHRRLQRKQIRPHTYLCFLNLPYSASFVTSMYVFTKFAYLANVIIQLHVMNVFLETSKYSLYGIGALVDFLNGTTWEQSGMFPRVSLCDFEVRVMGNVQSYTVQCVLIINIFNEKIFVLLWFWYVCLLIFSLGSLMFWLSVFLMPYSNRRFINRHLEMSELAFDVEANEKMVHNFIDNYLRSDGVFVVRMLTLHSGVIFGTELVLALWQSYYGCDGQLKRSSSFPKGDFLNSINDDDTEYGDESSKLRRRQLPSALQQSFQVTGEKLITPPSPPPDIIKAVSTPKMSIGSPQKELDLKTEKKVHKKL